MRSGSRWTARRRAGVAACGVGFAASTVALWVLAYHVIFARFVNYDDEGAVLIALREKLEGGALYDEVFSQYGPGFFALMGGVFELLGLPVDHDTGRLVTISLWAGASLLAGLTLLRLTRDPVIALSGQVISLALLAGLAREPMHPQSLVAFLIVAMIAVAAFTVPNRPSLAMFAVGAVAAELALIKVNVGAFALAAIALACVAHAPALRAAPVRLTVAAGFVATPFILMGGDLGEGMNLTYAAVVAAGALAVVVVAFANPPSRLLTAKRIGWLVGGMIATVVVVVGLALGGGTSIGGLIDGVVLSPLQQSEALSFPLDISPLASWWSLLGLAGALAASRWGRAATLSPRGRAIGGAARVAAGLGIWIAVVVPYEPIGLTAPLIWVAAVPPDREAGPSHAALLRTLLAASAVLQLLQAYPVAGAQVAVATLLAVVVGGVCVSDGVGELVRSTSVGMPGSRALRGLGEAILVVAIVSLLLPTAGNFSDGVSAYRAGVPLGLPGARKLRIQPEQAFELRLLTRELRDRCGAFLTLPGMNSLYFFTERAPPTRLNATHWMTLLDEDEQGRIVDEVRRTPDLCVVRNRPLVEFWRQEPFPRRPLLVWIRDRFRPVLRIGNYELMERKPATSRSAARSPSRTL